MFQTPSAYELERRIRDYLKNQISEESIYQKFVREAGDLDFYEINAKEVKRVFRSFLLKWGKMYRVIKHPRKEGWEISLAERLRKISKVFEKFREKDLSEINEDELDRLAEDIKRCYSAFREILGPTSAAKALHIIAPNFFPLWDSKIRDLYGIRETDDQAFLLFMKIVRKHWFTDISLKKSLRRLEKEFELSKLRIIDIYSWSVVKKRLS
jgi:hypothetical protein